MNLGPCSVSPKTCARCLKTSRENIFSLSEGGKSSARRSADSWRILVAIFCTFLSRDNINPAPADRSSIGARQQDAASTLLVALGGWW